MGHAFEAMYTDGERATVAPEDGFEVRRRHCERLLDNKFAGDVRIRRILDTERERRMLGRPRNHSLGAGYGRRRSGGRAGQ